MLPRVTFLHDHELLAAANNLPLFGILKISANTLCYLKIDDNYIRQLFFLLKKKIPNKTIKMPDYFGKEKIGAHISVIYPEEKINVSMSDVGQTHHFNIMDLMAAKIHNKEYYALRIQSNSLQMLRAKYFLPSMLNFKGYLINLHITIATLHF